MDAAFLQPQAVSDAVRDLLASAKHAKLAVSFWGRSAVTELQLLRSGLQLSVVLNLRSGAVDPAVVDLIGRDKVLAHDTLHAKIYWTDKGAIVGSCNASANGLGLVGTELDDGKLARWKESGVFLPPDTKPWRDAEVAVDTLMNEGSDINAKMMSAAKLAWAQRRRYRPPPAGQVSLAVAISNSPDLVLNRKVYLLLEEFADAAPPQQDRKGGNGGAWRPVRSVRPLGRSRTARHDRAVLRNVVEPAVSNELQIWVRLRDTGRPSCSPNHKKREEHFGRRLD